MRNCDSPDPKQRVVFEQPVLQTYVLDILVSYIKKSQETDC